MKGELTRVTWQEIKSIVKTVNPTLAKVIDRLKPTQTLYKVSYPFGATIVDKGLFYVPLENGEIVPVNDSRVSKELKDELAYANNGMPAGVVLKNAYELFINTPTSSILPIVTTKPGSIFALWKQLDTFSSLYPSSSFHPANVFSVTAGARSLFMLPNVGDTMLHNNLVKHFQVAKRPPNDLLDQWQIFKAIAEHENSSWRVELLLFPGSWLHKAKNDVSWRELYLLLLECAWNSSAFERNQIFYEFALSCAQANRNLRPNPYLLDTVRHVLSITLGATPGFKPATDELMAPIELLQKVYVESYGLKKYAPTIMHPVHFDIHNVKSSPVYYSFQLPTTISFSPRSRQLTSTIYDLKEVKYIMDTFLDEIKNNKVHLEDTVIDMIPKLKYGYFHSKPAERDGIYSSTEMVKQDASLIKALYKNSSSNFAYNGAFIRGCIRIGY